MALNSVISSYQLFLSSNVQGNEWLANIILCEKNNTPVIDLRFVADPEKFANKGKIVANGVSVIYVDASRYSSFIDILRNEAPLVAIQHSPIGTMPARIVLQTGPELTGEGEV